MGNLQKSIRTKIEILPKFPWHLLALLFAISLAWVGSTVSHAQLSPDRIVALAWNPDGTRLGVAGIIGGQTGIQLRSSTGQVIDFIATPGRVFSVSWSPDGTRLAGTYSVEGTVSHLTSIWELDTLNVLVTFEEIGAKDDSVAYWSPDDNGHLMVTIGQGLIRIWDTGTGAQLALLPPPLNNIGFETLRWNRDGTELLTISGDQTVRAWDVATLALLREVPVEAPTDLALSPDGNRLAVSDIHSRLTILDADTFTTQQVLSNDAAPNDPLLAVRWHPDGSQIAAYGSYNISVWDVTTGEVVITTPHAEPWPANPDAFDYSPAGRLTYVGAENAILIQPIADAGPNQTVADSDNSGTETVTLDGSGSYDSDGIIETYQWFENDILIAEGVTALVDLSVGEHIVVLTVVDNDGAIGTDEVVITVEPATACSFTITAGDAAGLISAIEAANANPDPDTICLAAGSTYTLTTVHNTTSDANRQTIQQEFDRLWSALASQSLTGSSFSPLPDEDEEVALQVKAVKNGSSGKNFLSSLMNLQQ